MRNVFPFGYAELMSVFFREVCPDILLLRFVFMKVLSAFYLYKMPRKPKMPHLKINEFSTHIFLSANHIRIHFSRIFGCGHNPEVTFQILYFSLRNVVYEWPNVIRLQNCLMQFRKDLKAIANNTVCCSGSSTMELKKHNSFPLNNLT